ncbi:MAG TPA: signal peptidase I [Bacteroidales bacterium]|nr:signal peptidase I [Bacteroidales bacterium]
MRILIICLICVGINELYAQADSSCITKISKKVVKGKSLEGVIANGSYVIMLYGFYNCNEIKRNDIVAYDYKGSKIPLIKMVKGLPGDTFVLVPTKFENLYNIIINGDTLREITGMKYEFKEAQYRMLNMYAKAYNNIIPPNAYLILGTHSGTTDSGKFGLIDKRDILGKIVY